MPPFREASDREGVSRPGWQHRPRGKPCCACLGQNLTRRCSSACGSPFRTRSRF